MFTVGLACASEKLLQLRGGKAFGYASQSRCEFTVTGAMAISSKLSRNITGSAITTTALSNVRPRIFILECSRNNESLSLVSRIRAAALCSSARPSCQNPNPNDQQQPASIQDLLQSRLGMSDDEISIVRKRDCYVLKSGSAMRALEAMQLLNNFGVRDSQLKLLCLTNPRFLVCRAEENMRPKLEALKSLGFTGEALGNILCQGHRIISTADLQGRLRRLEAAIGGSCNLVNLISQYPQILNYNVEQIERQLSLLKRTGMTDEAFARMLFKSPIVLKGCPDRFAGVIEELKKIGVPVTSKRFPWALSAIARCGGSLEERTKALAIAGFDGCQIKQIFAKQPQLLGMSPETLQRKAGFLANSAGVSLHSIVKTPPLLGYSVENRLKPRLALFRSLSAAQPFVKLPSLEVFFGMANRKLMDKYVKGNRNEAKLLQMMKDASQQSHSVEKNLILV